MQVERQLMSIFMGNMQNEKNGQTVVGQFHATGVSGVKGKSENTVNQQPDPIAQKRKEA
ncbi:MAG: hypothetical protein PHP50_00365 [Lachnospiraceae bacterium]|nr:hypothetical protein [Lachnospiraceae bacterium]